MFLYNAMSLFVLFFHNVAGLSDQVLMSHWVNKYFLWQFDGISRVATCASFCYKDNVCSSFRYALSLGKCAGYRYGMGLSTRVASDFVHVKFTSCSSACDRSKGFVHDTSVSPSMCYKFALGMKTWEEAKSVCSMINGRLIVLDSDKRVKVITEFLRGFRDDQAKSWVGLRHKNNQNRKRIFTWLNNSTYVKLWEPGQPDFVSRQHCGQVTVNGISDNFCDHSMHYICERV